MSRPRIQLLEVPLSLHTPDGVVGAVSDASAGPGGYIVVCNVHSVMTARRDSELRKALEESLATTLDGMPLVWGLRALGHHAERLYGQALMERLLGGVDGRITRHYFIGSTDLVQQRLLAVIRDRFPRANIVGRWVPPFEPGVPGLPQTVREDILAAKPRIIWVGLGCPKQERWMARHWRALAPAVLIGVGAAFEYMAGTKRTPPMWMRRNGLEWLFRLLTEPRRLAWRYLSTNPDFILRFGIQLVRDRWGRAPAKDA